MVESEVIFISHPIGDHIISYAPRCAAVEPLPAPVIAHTERLWQHGIANVTELGSDGSAVALGCNIIGIDHNDPFGKSLHLLILDTAEIQLFLPPLTSFYIPEIASANREGYVEPAILFKELVSSLILP